MHVCVYFIVFKVQSTIIHPRKGVHTAIRLGAAFGTSLGFLFGERFTTAEAMGYHVDLP